MIATIRGPGGQMSAMGTRGASDRPRWVAVIGLCLAPGPCTSAALTRANRDKSADHVTLELPLSSMPSSRLQGVLVVTAGHLHESRTTFSPREIVSIQRLAPSRFREPGELGRACVGGPLSQFAGWRLISAAISQYSSLRAMMWTSRHPPG